VAKALNAMSQASFCRKPGCREPGCRSLVAENLGSTRSRAERPFRCYGLFVWSYIVWSYTSRMVLITVPGPSNWIYSELRRAKICSAFEDRPSQRTWGKRCLLLIFQVLRRVRRLPLQVAHSRWPTPWFLEVGTRMGREPNRVGVAADRLRPMPSVSFPKELGAARP
jgi:hypothetical protein